MLTVVSAHAHNRLADPHRVRSAATRILAVDDGVGTRDVSSRSAERLRGFEGAVGAFSSDNSGAGDAFDPCGA